MKKLIAILALVGLAAGLGAGLATADEADTPAGTIHYGVTDDGEVYVVGEGNGTETPDGYIGVESNDGAVAGCNTDDPATPADESGEYTAGEGSAVDPTTFGSGNTSCLE